MPLRPEPRISTERGCGATTTGAAAAATAGGGGRRLQADGLQRMQDQRGRRIDPAGGAALEVDERLAHRLRLRRARGVDGAQHERARAAAGVGRQRAEGQRAHQVGLPAGGLPAFQFGGQHARGARLGGPQRDALDEVGAGDAGQLGDEVRRHRGHEQQVDRDVRFAGLRHVQCEAGAGVADGQGPGRRRHHHDRAFGLQAGAQVRMTGARSIASPVATLEGAGDSSGQLPRRWRRAAARRGSTRSQVAQGRVAVRDGIGHQRVGAERAEHRFDDVLRRERAAGQHAVQQLARRGSWRARPSRRGGARGGSCQACSRGAS